MIYHELLWTFIIIHGLILALWHFVSVHELLPSLCHGYLQATMISVSMQATIISVSMQTTMISVSMQATMISVSMQAIMISGQCKLPSSLSQCKLPWSVCHCKLSWSVCQCKLPSSVSQCKLSWSDWTFMAGHCSWWRVCNLWIPIEPNHDRSYPRNAVNAIYILVFKYNQRCSLDNVIIYDSTASIIHEAVSSDTKMVMVCDSTIYDVLYCINNANDFAIMTMWMQLLEGMI